MTTLLKVINLTKKFGDFTAVDRVSFEAHAGEIFGLLGPNGAGKTTTLRTIATVLAPSSGTATVCGIDIVQHPEAARKHLGMLTTDVGVYERFSGRENLQYFGELYGLSGTPLDTRISELSQLLEMDDFLDRRAGKYSTGMRQKLAIARSVIHDPEVIIFDEPTSGLDVLASQTVLAFMRKAKELGKCVVLSTHQMTDAEKLCDRVVIIHQGRVIADDTVPAVESATKATDLEEAFLRLVRTMPKEKQTTQPVKKTSSRIASIPSWVLTGIALVLVALFFAFRQIPALAPVKAISYLFLVLGVLIGSYSRYFQKKK